MTFGRDVAPSSVNANTVALIDGRDGHVVPTTPARSGRTVTLTPAARLQAGAPYVVWVAGVTDPTGAEFAYEQVPFTTVGAASPRYDITRTLRPFRIDLDGNGFDDIFWYALGDAVDSIWFHGTDGRAGVNTQVIGTSYTPLAGDFDGNGYDDVFRYGPGAGTDVMWWEPAPASGPRWFPCSASTSPSWAISTATASTTSSGTGRGLGPTRRGTSVPPGGGAWRRA